MKICYPFRNTNGQEFRSQDEVMRLIDAEAHGSWLLGANGLWHGGIHISDITQPFSALNPDAINMGDPVPLQFMADGILVAYRLNRDYLTAPYCGEELRFSSTFVLVKSTCMPDLEQESTWLDFYNLYMHLAPASDYPASPCYKVKAGRTNILLRNYIKGQNGLPEGEDSGEFGTYAASSNSKKRLNAGERVVSSRTGRFYVKKNGQTSLVTFGLVRLLKGKRASDKQYWVTLDPELMEPDGEIADLMPAWMIKAQDKGEFNSVVLTDETDEWKVSAGTPVGFMGCMESPGIRGGLVDKDWFVHLEVLSADPRMPRFLSNPGDVKGEKRFVSALKGKQLYIRQGEGEPEEFVATTTDLGKQCLLPRDSTTPVQDEATKWWYKVSGSGWLPQDNVEEIGQYDLLKQGFQPLEESSNGDMMNSPYENWVPEVFGKISRAAEQGNHQYNLVPKFYRDLMVKMDSNRDGKVSAEEIRQALTVRDSLVREVVNRLVVKHHSEWFGGRSTGRWEGFYKDLDVLETQYCEKWQGDMEWMSKVAPFNQGEPVWHFHPVVFLEAFKIQMDWFDIEAFISKYKEQHHIVFGFYERGNKINIPQLNQESEISLRSLLYEMKSQYYNYFDSFNEKFVAYMLATVRIESYDFRRSVFFKPISEGISYEQAEHDYGSGPTATNRRRAILNHNASIGDGYRYRGRGLVQLTWKINYEKFMKVTGADIVTNPDFCLEENTAVSIMMKGMRDGVFRTGHTLDGYLGGGKRDYFNARLIINGYSRGIPDKAGEFQDFAELFEVIINESM